MVQLAPVLARPEVRGASRSAAAYRDETFFRHVKAGAHGLSNPDNDASASSVGAAKIKLAARGIDAPYVPSCRYG